MRAVDTASLTTWYDAYLERFAAAGRGEHDAASVLDCYAVPLLVSNDDVVATLASREEVLAVVEGQLAGMRAEGYARTDLESVEHRVVSRTTAVVEGSFVRVRGDGSEIARHTATYLVTESDGATRIAALCLHGT